ncbi:MAG: potassium channel family protein [Anaerolineaceae bacterium]|nr:potassium channel family protein [Anaerolineaceae bacterium]
MFIVFVIGGSGLIVLVLIDAFETVVLPRRVNTTLQLTALFYRFTWKLWSAPARWKLSGQKRETYLAFFGPLSLLVLLGIWSIGLVFGFAMLYHSIPGSLHAVGTPVNFWVDLYASGTTFFTLGLGDVIPATAGARVLMIVEVGMGFAFLALVIGYLPILYQSFSRREANISLLDARAGSPPTAFELVRRCGGEEQCQATTEFLATWERWSAELLETHLSYPVLGYYRSQHENQSWLAAMAVLLDTSALAMIGIDGVSRRQARLTFAMTRHTIVDLAQIYRTPPTLKPIQRFSEPEFESFRSRLSSAGMILTPDLGFYQQLADLRELYEPYIDALSSYFLMPVPGWAPSDERPDNWMSSAWKWGA